MNKIKNKKSLLIIIVFLILILISIGIYYYNSTKKIKEDTNNIEETTNNEIIEEENDYDPILDETFYKYQYNSAILYKNVDYDKPNVEVLNNDIILSLTWNEAVSSQITSLMHFKGEFSYNTDFKLYKIETDNISYDNDKFSISLPREKMNEYVKKYFGSEVEYVDDNIPLDYDYVAPFTFDIYQDLVQEGSIKYSDGVYQANYVPGTNEETPYILTSVTIIEEDKDYVKIYAKSAFIDIEKNNDDAPSTNRIYKEFDSKTNEFVNALGVFESYEDYENIRNELHTFLYTYKIDKETEEYYLASFILVE